MSFLGERNAIALGVSQHTVLYSGLLQPQSPPSLILDFAGTQTLDPRITFTRSTTATFIGSNGLIQTAAINAPRFDYNPTTLAPLGLLIEEQRVNLLLNSATLTTQNVTVSAVAHTLSFYGTGTVTLSGVSTAGPLVGTGAYPNRVSLTFTPTAGTLTLTVSGSVVSAQLEAGAFATSYIPTVASQVTRTADVAVMTGTNFSSWYNQAESTVYAEYSARNGGRAIMFDDGSTDNRFEIRFTSNTSQLNSWSGNVQQISSLFAPTATGLPEGVILKSSAGLLLNNAATTANGASPGTDTSCIMPLGLTRVFLGSFQGTATFLNGRISRITYYPRRLSNSELQGVTL